MDQQVSHPDPHRELTKLLHRALRSAPRVKLEKVDEVIALFESAVDVLEANCDLTPEERVQAQRDRKVIEETYRATVMARPPVEGAHDVGSDSDDEGEGEDMFPERKEVFADSTSSDTVPIARDFTRDYSSPRGSTRSLAAQPRKGISSRATSAHTRVGHLEEESFPASSAGAGRTVGLSGTGGGTKKPLGRFNPVVARAVGLPIEGHRGRVRERGDTERHRSYGQEEDDDVAASPVRYTQDYSSPRSQTRQLEAKSQKGRSSRATTGFVHRESEDSESMASASGDGEELARTEDEEHEAEAVTLSLPPRPRTGPSPRLAAKENRLAKRDLVDVARDREKDKDSEVVLTASPTVARTSRRLVELATPVSEGRRLREARTEEMDMVPARSAAPSLPSAMEAGPGVGSGTGTPKPAFLRRLDTPDSNTGKLAAAKTRLNSLLQYALALAPRMNPEAFDQTSTRFAEAIKALESATTSP